MKIKHETLARKEQAKMELEQAVLNLLKECTRSQFTGENVFRFKENSQWELDAELAKLDAELKGYLRHLKPQAEAEIRQKYSEDYFTQIEKCFEDCPTDLTVADVEVKDGVLNYKDTYIAARLASATLELSEQEAGLYNALCEARTAVSKLKQLCGSSLWSGDLEFLLFSDLNSEEIAFNYISSSRNREKFINKNN